MSLHFGMSKEHPFRIHDRHSKHSVLGESDSYKPDQDPLGPWHCRFLASTAWLSENFRAIRLVPNPFLHDLTFLDQVSL